MGKEDEIAVRLQKGATPRELLDQGFRKSTVYKVAESLRSHNAPSPPSLLVVQLNSDRARYLPGEVANLVFTITNNSASDLYVFQTGLRPEWLGGNDWMPSTLRKLLGAGDATTVRLTVPIPPHVVLGEKELYFGIQGQWVGPQSASPSGELMWTGPLILPVQRNPTGMKVFLSHSVLDAALISRLDSMFDDNGITTIVAGPDLPMTEIEQADFVVALITDSTRLDSVIGEISHAHAHGKQLILLRNATLAQALPPQMTAFPWIDVDFSSGNASIVVRLVAALTETIETRLAARKKEQEDTLGVIVLGLAALAAAIALGKGKPG